MIDRVKRDYPTAEISDKLKSLLAIAGKVPKSGKHATPEDIARARQRGATDKEIHDTVLIAAAFCMFNRHVDGLDTWQPTDPNDYREMGQIMAHVGYVRPDWGKNRRSSIDSPRVPQQFVLDFDVGPHSTQQAQLSIRAHPSPPMNSPRC